MKRTVKNKIRATAFFGVLLSSQAFSSTVSGTNILSINGTDSSVSSYNSSTVNLLSGSDVTFLDTYDTSSANLYDGTLSWLTLHGNSSASLYSSNLGWLEVGQNATVNIYGSNFNYSGGILNGTWSSGASFSFWALSTSDNGQIIDSPSNVMPSNITLNSVPLPSSILLFASALAALNFRRKSKTGA
jgi:hypothetical protein